MQTPIDIHALRVALGCTQEQLARRIGVSFLTISRWERGKANPSPLAREKLDKLIKVVKKSPA
jgi:transcriptional regulator with XRE-family HTH domain